MKDFSTILNRLKKNQKRLKSFLKSGNIEAFRLYEKDIPEYPYIVDCYGPKIVVYEKGKKLEKEETELAKTHQEHLRSALNELYPKAEIIFKKRIKQKGKQQYEREQRSRHFFTIQEGPLKFQVNLRDYLDTGLFLDHRPLRQKLIKESKGKDILNLFCYTGSLSVAAAFGGATTTSADMSNTYLNWAKENFLVNDLNPDEHQFVRADVTEWIHQLDKSYDLILLDPPSFSNSKKMEDSFNIQDAHVEMIHQLMKHLKSTGQLIFSNNFRKFKIDSQIEDQYQVRNTTDKTIPQDFRDKKIHQSFCICHK